MVVVNWFRCEYIRHSSHFSYSTYLIGPCTYVHTSLETNSSLVFFSPSQKDGCIIINIASLAAFSNDRRQPTKRRSKGTNILLTSYLQTQRSQPKKPTSSARITQHSLVVSEEEERDERRKTIISKPGRDEEAKNCIHCCSDWRRVMYI